MAPATPCRSAPCKYETRFCVHEYLRLHIKATAATIQKQPMLQQERQSSAVMTLTNGPMLTNFGGLILDGRMTGHFSRQAATVYGRYHKSPRYLFLKRESNRQPRTCDCVFG
jgi:hypothetical protein